MFRFWRLIRSTVNRSEPQPTQAGAKIRALQAELSEAQQARVQLKGNLRCYLVTQAADTSGALAAVQLVEGQLGAPPLWLPPNSRWRFRRLPQLLPRGLRRAGSTTRKRLAGRTG
jgi:hypothetical protein